MSKAKGEREEMLRRILDSEQAKDWLKQLRESYFDRDARKEIIDGIRQSVDTFVPQWSEGQRKSFRDAVISELVNQILPTAKVPEAEAPREPWAKQKKHVRDHYPLPIVEIFDKFAEATSKSEEWLNLLFLVESLIHYLATVALSAYFRAGLRDARCNTELLKIFLREKWSMGTVADVLMTIIKLAGDCEGRLPYGMLPPYLFTAKKEQTNSCKWLIGMSEVRNDTAHGGGITEEFADKLLSLYKPALQCELANLSWLKECPLIRPTVIEAGRVRKADILMALRADEDCDFDLVLNAEDLAQTNNKIRPEKSLLLLTADRRHYLHLIPFSLFHISIQWRAVFFLEQLEWGERRELTQVVYKAYQPGRNQVKEYSGDQFVECLKEYLQKLEPLESVLADGWRATTQREQEQRDPDYEMAGVWDERNMHRQHFVGRESWLQQLHHWIEDQVEGSYLLLLGPPGQGKSALLAELGYREDHRKSNCLFHMVKSHSDPLRFVPSLLSQAAKRAETHFGASAYMGKCDDLREALRRALAIVRDKHGRAVLVIDALDEMASDNLDWLPPSLPEGVCAVLSCRPDSRLLNRLRLRLSNLTTCDLPRFTENDFRLLLERRLEIGTIRQLGNAIDWKAVYARAEGNPLLLTAAIKVVNDALTRHRFLEQDALNELVSSFDRVFESIYREIAALDGTSDEREVGEQRAWLLKFLCRAREPLRLEHLSELMSANGTPLSLEKTVQRVGEMTEYLLSFSGDRFLPWHSLFTEYICRKVLGQEGCRRIEDVYCRWFEATRGSYALQHRVRHIVTAHLLGKVQFERMHQLLQEGFLDEKSNRVGIWEALGDTELLAKTLALEDKEQLRFLAEQVGIWELLQDSESLAETLAQAGLKQWQLFRQCTRRHCQRIGQLRSDPVALEKMVAERQLERIWILLRGDFDDFRKGFLMMALAPLVAEQGDRDLAEEFASKGEAHVALQLQVQGLSKSVAGHSRETTALAYALWRPYTEKTWPRLPRPVTGFAPAYLPHPRGLGWIGKFLCRVGRWSPRLIVLAVIGGVYLFPHQWWAVLLLGAGVWICYSRLVSRPLERKQAALMRAFTLGMETGRDEDRRVLLRQALELACWQVPKPNSWHEEMVYLLLRGYPLFTATPAEAAQIALDVADRRWPVWEATERIEVRAGNTHFRRIFEWWPAGEAVIRALNGLNDEQRNAIHAAIYDRLGKRRPSLNLLCLLAATGSRNADANAFLQSMARYASVKGTDVGRLGRQTLSRAPAIFLARAALRSLQRDDAAPGQRALLAQSWSWLKQAFVLVGQMTTPLAFRRHAPYGLAGVLEEDRVEKRQHLAAILHRFVRSTVFELRPLHEVVLAQALLRNDRTSRTLVAAKKVFKRVLTKLIQKALLNQRAVALAVMDNQDLLDVVLRRQIVPTKEQSLRRVDESDDDEQLRRMLPLQPVWGSWLLTAGISSAAAALCLVLLAAHVAEPVRSWLQTWGMGEAVAVCVALTFFQHFFSFVQRIQATPYDSFENSSGRAVRPSLFREPVKWLKVQDGNLDEFPLRRIVAGALVLVLLACLNLAIVGHSRQTYPTVTARVGWLVVFLSLLISNLLTPALIANWRGTWLLYPRFPRLNSARAGSLMVFVGMSLFLTWLVTLPGWLAVTHEVFTLSGHNDGIYSVAFRPDGRFLASASADQTVKVWDARSGSILFTLSEDALSKGEGTIIGRRSSGERPLGHTDAVTSVVFHPDGQSLASASLDGTIRIWDFASRETIRTLNFPPLHYPWEISYSHDGKFLLAAVANYSPALRLLVPPNGAWLPCPPMRIGAIAVFDASTGEKVRDCPVAHVGGINSAAFSVDGRFVVSGGNDRMVKLWDRQTGQLLRSLAGHRGAVTEVAYSSDGKWLATSSVDQTVKLWDADSGAELRTLRGHERAVEWVGFHPSLPLLASTSDDQTVRLWDVRTGEEVLRLQGHTESILGGAFDPDGRFLAIGGADRTVRMWELRSLDALTLRTPSN